MSRRNKRGRKGLARLTGDTMTAVRKPRENHEKLSTRIIAIGGDFLTRDDLPFDERQDRLNAVCSAWNMANLPLARRQQVLARYMHDHQQYSDFSDEDISMVRRVMEALIDEKLRRYPDDQRCVHHAKLTMSGSTMHVTVGILVAAP